MNELLERINQAAESILDNERLTTDLNDHGGSALTNWAMDCAKQIVVSSVQDDVLDEDQISDRLQAVRRLMRLMNHWVSRKDDMDDAGKNSIIDQLIEQSKLIYGNRYIEPNRIQRVVFLNLDKKSTSGEKQAVHDMRRLLESQMKYHAISGENSNAKK